MSKKAKPNRCHICQNFAPRRGNCPRCGAPPNWTTKRKEAPHGN